MEHGRSDDVIVASFLDSATAAFARYAPRIGISAGTEATTEFYRRVHAGEPPQDDIGRYVALQVPARFGPVVVVDEQFVEVAHSCGLAVHVWTVDDPEEMEHLVGLGVDGIISDKPTVLAGVLEPPGSELEACEAQPRPQFGFLPWLAFFFLRSLRFTVRLDTSGTV